MGDLQSEESRDVVLQLTIDALAEAREEESPQPLFEAEMNYFNVLSGQISSENALLNVLRTSESGFLHFQLSSIYSIISVASFFISETLTG